MSEEDIWNMRLTEERKELMNELEDRLGIGVRSKLIDECMRKTKRFLDLKAEKKKNLLRILAL